MNIKKWHGNAVTESERLRCKMSLKSNTSKKKARKNSINTSELSEKQRETQIITSQEKE